jgi:hypothetical protein
MRPENDERIEDLQRARKLAEGFVAGEIEFVPFYEGLTFILGATFDGLDSQLHELPDAVQREVRFYSDWTGGEWGETEDRLPKRNGWRYGENLEPYGWIDKKTYQQEFAAAFELMELHDLSAWDA